MRGVPASTTGAVFVETGGATSIVTSSNADNSPSFAVSRTTYVPGAPNEADVVAVSAGVKVTVPGPDCFVQDVVGTVRIRASSVTVPARMAGAGNVMAMSAPSVTEGGAFTGSAATVTVRVTDANPPRASRTTSVTG